MAAAVLTLAGCGGTTIYAPSGGSLGAPVIVSPAALSFTALGAVAALPVTVSEAGFAGAFTAQSSDPSVATVAGPTGTPASFVITPVAGGSATVTIFGRDGQSAPVAVSVTSATFVPQERLAR